MEAEDDSKMTARNKGRGVKLVLDRHRLLRATITVSLIRKVRAELLC
jgi:hypothetical protein